MADEVQKTQYEELVEEFRKVPGPVDASLQYIQDGIEMEVFRDTPAGKIIIGRSMEAMRTAIESILHPHTSGQGLLDAVQELRVQHRLLNTVAGTIQLGREAEKRIQISESGEQENPDDDSL